MPKKKRSRKQNTNTGRKRGERVLDYAVKVLKRRRRPMRCGELVTAVIRMGWVTSGATPERTLSAALHREIAKGRASRVKKVGRGQFKHA